MNAIVGRTIPVGWGAESPQPIVAGVREKSVTLGGAPVDITNDDSLGWQTLLDAPQINSLEISCSGVAVDDTLRADWFAGASIGSGRRMQPASFIYPDGGVISGTFYLSEYSETGNHDGEVTFEATFMSSGVAIYTPAGSP